MDLYRYMSFEVFIDIVINKKLTLLSPTKWEDSYEGWFLKGMTKSEKVGTMIKKYIDSVCGQCWSKNGDHVPLWSIYSYGNKSIMIKTTLEDLESLNGVYCKEMTYSDGAEISIDEIVKLLTEPTPENMLIPFTKKRSGFEHENEYRIFAFTECKPSIDIMIPNITEFVKGVMVHPFADDWYVDIVKSVCDKFNLPFDGKSELYKFEDGD